MKAIKKQTFYQLDPRFFKDYSGNGTGDLKGLAAKVDYFDFIGIENLILQNLLALDEDQKIQEYTRISQELGTANEIKTIISLLEAKGINLFIEIPIGSIKESHRWFQKAVDTKTQGFNKLIEFKPNVEDTLKTQKFKYSQEQKGYYEYDETTKEIPLNWSDNAVIEQFAEVVRYWNSLGVRGFVFTGFEYVADPSKKQIMNDATLRELRKFYNTIKEVNDDITLVGKSSIIFKDSYTIGASKVFDYFMTEQFALLGLHKEFKTDLIGKFKPSKLAKMLSSFATSPNHILTFGSNLAGRINSRWGNSGQWSHESAKILSMLLLLNPASSAIYYGDEIGSLNIGLTRLDDFQDDNLFVRKEPLLKDGVKDGQIMNAQILQAPINSRSLMAWDDTKNGGFSNNEKTITPVSTTYREINVKNQYADESSPLLFNKELIRIVTSSSYRNIITKGKFSISSLIPGVIKLTFKLDKRELRAYVNLTDKVKPIKRAKVGKVVLSNKYHKVYNDLPRSLDAFEGVIISKQTDEAYKETVQLKLHKKKESERIAKEVEKTRIIEIKNQEKEAKRIEQEKEQAILAKQAAKEEAQREKERIALEKQKEAEKIEQEKEQKALEKQAAKEEAQREKEKIALEKQKEAERTRELEFKEAQRAEKEAAKAELAKQKEQEKIALEKQKEAERTRQLELKETQRAEKEAAKAELAKQKEQEKLERQKQKEIARAEKESEKTRQLELKKAQRAEKEAAKVELAKQKEEERTKQLELKEEEKLERQKQKEAKYVEKELAKQEHEKHKEEEKVVHKKEKDFLHVEKEAAKKMREEAKRFEIMDEQIQEYERTSLTEDQIAETTQIDTDEIDDFEAFLHGEDDKKK